MLKKVWKGILKVIEPVGLVMSTIVNFLLLTFVYTFGIGLVSIVMKLMGKNFMQIKKQNKSTNWHDHKLTKEPLEKYYRTF